MKKFESYFITLFVIARVSEANFVHFVEDHLQRLIANNTGNKYTALITALTSMLAQYKAAIDTRNLNKALLESKTKTVDQHISLFKSLLSGRMYLITEKWDADSPVYQEFFPQGMEDFHQATKGNIESKMNRFISAADLHRGDLPENFVAPFVSACNGFKTNRTQQLNLKGTVNGNRLAVANLRKALDVQITVNLLTLAIDHVGHPEAVNVYFDQSIIHRPVNKPGEEPEPVVYSEAVAPNTKVVVMHGGFDANTSFHIVNTGSVNIKFYTANAVDDPLSGNAVELAPDEECDVYAAELGGSGNLYLMAFNPDTVTAGSYEVSLEEDL
jgi:hypothetical protein